MAVHQRTTASSPTQEPPLRIVRVALYARVSTLNGQDPEMQLSELRGTLLAAAGPSLRRYVDQGVSGSKEISTSTESIDGRRSPTEVRCRACLEDRSFRSFIEASGQCPGRPLRLRSRLCQLSRQPRSQYSIRSPDVPDHRRHGGIRAVADPGAGKGRSTKCARQGQKSSEGPGSRLMLHG